MSRSVMNSMFKKTFAKYIIVLLICFKSKAAIGEIFTLGYLTGSQRRSGNLDYHKPGLTISGAISLAVTEINSGKLKTLGHSLAFIVGETYGEEVSSIRQTASLWKSHVAGYIGPQETCVHEGRMAAAFNLPMISYFCTHAETSNKKDFPTFARTRPPDTQISKSVVSLLLAYNWNKVTFLYLDSVDNEFGDVAETVLSTFKFHGIEVHKALTWNTIYYHGYAHNPFDELVESTFLDTRIYVILSHQYEHIGLMTSLYKKGLLDKGEYFVVGVDIEQYDSSSPDKYLRGVLQVKTDPASVIAFQSYLAVVPSAPVLFSEFARLVNRYMEMEPFNYPNPLGHIGGVKQIPAEAAYLYDAVHLYARALIKILESDENPKNGTAIVDYIKGTSYSSAMGYLVYIDDNGDAAGNYTILSMKSSQNNSNEYGLYPIGTFNAPQLIEVPELQLFDEIKWVGSGPPIAEPRCGFRGEKCISYTGEISAGIAGGAVVVLILVSLVLYRNWRYEQELDSLLWKVDFKEIEMHENEKDNNSQQKQTRATHPLIRTSQVSLSSNPDADFRYSTIFTPIGIYKGQLYAIKKVRKKCIDITREMKMELKMLRDLRHDNICAFIGACTDPPNICIVTEYCTRGSLKDVLENEDVKLDNMFTASMVADIIRGMLYLHDSPLRYHGALSTSNCLIDSRWVVKLSDFGLQAFKKGSEETNDIQTMNAKCLKLLYRAPELLRLGPAHEIPGTAKGDIYSFGIVLYEIHTRHGPFGETGLSPIECLKKVLQPNDMTPPFRPSLQPLESSFDCVRECLKECWSEKADDRPDLKAIRTKLRPLRKGMRANIFDNMMAMMEKYANNLEALVDERTDQLQEEKKKTDALLLEMLPRPVAEQLKKGNKVEAETYDMVTIYFSDIVGFTAMSAESTPLQVVDFLNDLYTCFDSIIGNYDVYKVETIGDAYMVVSGLPIRNGILHVAEIASMSLHLLNAVSEFKIRHRPHEQLLLRIGIHSGPVVAGVVGLKMPRYCLFGDTVNTASRMESTGMPLKIHCSGPCKELLERMGGYDLQERGFIPMKGKGDQKTYWLQGEDEIARQYRTKERNNRRGSRALMKAQLESKPHPNDTGPKSSLKNRNFPKSLIPRSSSLESPKKLRFASGNLLLEHHRYHSDDALMEVLSDTSPRKSNGSIRCEDITSSCPCIEHFGNFSDSPTSCPTASTPLL
ncbi:guanylate cyclase 32E isoform X2 [Bradysia coprophila]|uniref:guanylate cyclase 32E isoform X2 n=1 Tax=Bradysia coprophila TaxID=38358 RepID=UPI00187DB5F0|nr:guanylate cyclase 32E isoform X2 [Bradysia coprophila]